MFVLYCNTSYETKQPPHTQSFSHLYDRITPGGFITFILEQLTIHSEYGTMNHQKEEMSA